MPFRFTRTVNIGSNVSPPQAIDMARKLAEHVTRKFGDKIEYGVQLFGQPAIFWYADNDDLSKLANNLAALLGDREYLGLIGEAHSLWEPGTLKDSLVRLF